MYEDSTVQASSTHNLSLTKEDLAGGRARRQGRLAPCAPHVGQRATAFVMNLPHMPDPRPRMKFIRRRQRPPGAGPDRQSTTLYRSVGSVTSRCR